MSKPSVIDHKATADARDQLQVTREDVASLMSEILGKGRQFRFRAGGGSMAPFIRNGDVLTVTPLEGSPRLGDVVAALQSEPDGLVVHRVISIVGCGSQSVVLKGDNNGSPDGCIAMAAVIGRVAGVERRGRQIRIGLGPERRVIAFMSKIGATQMCLALIRRIRMGATHG